MIRSSRDALSDRVVTGASPIHGIGCFARVPLAAEEFIGTFTGPAVAADGEHVLWASHDGQHWEGRLGTSPLRYLNHSDSPNAVFEGFDLYAASAIDAGQEITINYQP